MKIEKNTILDEIKIISQHDVLPINQIDNKSITYSPIKKYFDDLKIKVKPETAANDLLQNFLTDITTDETKRSKISPEVNIEGSFIDYIVNETGTCNPICIELKPLFKFDSKKEVFKQEQLKFINNREQIQKYLRHKNVEYVILTNLNKAYIFNRNAIIDYKPFIETTLSDIFKQYLIHDNLWDTVRRYEDNITLFDLDKVFFLDLKKWYEELSKIELKENGVISKEEIVVLFLNKFIFIKTLEDYGLIPYHFIQDEYKRYIYKWEAKGNEIIFKHFFDEIEEFFEMYYDTELFTSNFWDFVDKKDNNIDDFKYAFELILGLDAWSEAYGKGLTHYNYRKIDEDIFGKAYETWIAENKKDEGIYYTPSVITEYMANKLVDYLFDDLLNKLVKELKDTSTNINKINTLVRKLKSIKIIDTASGSGSFLIKVLKAIYKKYKSIEEATRWVADIHHDNIFDVPPVVEIINGFRKNMFFSNGTELHLISSIILNHIFAADKDERAIETAKTNIWKEAVKLNPRIYNYRRLDKDKIHILPNLAMNFITGDSLTDIDFDRQIEIIKEEFNYELIKLFEIREKYIKNPYKPDILSEAKEIKNRIKERFKKEPACFEDSLFFPLEYFFCFFSTDGKALPKDERGFNGIIGNPPWEELYPVKKEFASKYNEFSEIKTGKYALNMTEFEKYFNKILNENNKINKEWEQYQVFYKNYTEFMDSKYTFYNMKPETSQAMRTHVNIFKLFLERNIQLIKNNAYLINLVPSSFQTDEGCFGNRKQIMLDNTLLELLSFENRGYQVLEKNHKVKFFPDVHPQFKFSIVFTQKKRTENYDFKGKFYVQSPEEMLDENFIEYNVEKIKEFSPENLSIMEFRFKEDYTLCSKIAEGHKTLYSQNYTLKRELNVTDDAGYFKQKSKKNVYRIFEGKMIHQFNSNFDEANYYIETDIAEEILSQKSIGRIARDLHITKKEIEDEFVSKRLLPEHHFYRLAYRAIGSSTNERTLISSILPKNVASVNSLNQLLALNYHVQDNKIILNRIEYGTLIYLMSVFNSLTLNYYIRNKISANLNMFYIYELPIAEAGEVEKKKIVELGFSLLYRKSNKDDFEDLKKELGIEVIDERPPEEIRAELEIIIAKNLYHLDKPDWEYLTSTFTYGADSVTKKELDQIIKISLEKW